MAGLIVEFAQKLSGSQFLNYEAARNTDCRAAVS